MQKNITRALALFSLFLAFFICHSPFILAEDWPMAAFNRERHNCTPEAFRRGPALNKALWRAQISDVLLSHVTPITAEGKAIIPGWSGNVYAFDLFTGAKAWQAELGSPIFSTACHANGKIFVGCHDGRLAALNAGDGALLWEFRCGGSVWASPLVDQGLVMAGARDGVFYAVDAETGKLKWSFECSERIMCTAASDGERVYFGAEDMRGHAMEIATGREAWVTEQMSFSSFGLAWPVVTAGRVIFTGNTLVAQKRYYAVGDEIYRLAVDSGDEDAKSVSLQESLERLPEFQCQRIFDAETGKQGPIVAALYNQGHWGPMAPAVVRDSGEVVIRSLGEHAWMSDACGWSRVDLDTGHIYQICKPSGSNWLDVPYGAAGCKTGLFVDPQSAYTGNAIIEFVPWDETQQIRLASAADAKIHAPDSGVPATGMSPKIRSTGLTSPAVLSRGILLKLGTSNSLPALWAFDMRE